MAGPVATEDAMTRAALGLLTMILATQPLAPAAAPVRDEPAREALAIFERVQQANARREAALESYLSTRHYAVFEPGHETDAELLVSMQFVAPSTKTFRTIAVRGVGWIHRRVFGRLMEAEAQAASGRDKTNSAITPANYDAQLLGSEALSGRDCYVLALVPKRPDTYLFIGKAWIDKEDFAIVRLEGEPAKSPSFWVVRAPFVREYQRVDRFWLPLQDETHTVIRFAGPYVLRIQYADYHITAKP
jgi:hypothetical protein